MKCPHCGANLSLEDERCPYCGQINEQARIHVRDMKRYQGEFSRTQAEVYRKTSRFGAITARCILLGVLLFLLIVSFALRGSSYSIARSLKTSDAKKHAAEYTAQMDALLEEGRYLEFSEFCEYHQLDTYYKGPFEKYGALRTASRYFLQVYTDIATFRMPGEYTNDRLPGYLAESLNNYYRYTGEEQISNFAECDTEQTWDAVAGMDRQLAGMLTGCLGISQEEAESLRSQKEARRSLIIEEACLNEQED